jgi:hypothetical protein
VLDERRLGDDFGRGAHQSKRTRGSRSACAMSVRR